MSVQIIDNADPNAAFYHQQLAAAQQRSADIQAAGVDQHNKFLMSQIDFRHAQALAQQQQESQMALNEATSQRMQAITAARDKMFLDRASDNNAARLKAERDNNDQKNVHDAVTHLQQLGGSAPAHVAGETTQQYIDRVNVEQTKITGTNKTQSTQRIYASLQNIDMAQEHKARVQAALQADAQKVALGENQPGSANFNKWMTGQPDENQQAYAKALAATSNPIQALQAAGLDQAYKSEVQAKITEAASTLSSQKGYGAALASDDASIERYTGEIQSATTGADTQGRFGQLPWGNQAYNDAYSQFQSDKAAKQQALAQQQAAAFKAPAPVAAPVAAPAATNNVDPYAAYKAYGITGTNGGLMLPGSGEVAPAVPGMANPNPVAPLSAADAARWGISLPAATAPAGPAIQQFLPPGANPFQPPTAPNVILPPAVANGVQSATGNPVNVSIPAPAAPVAPTNSIMLPPNYVPVPGAGQGYSLPDAMPQGGNNVNLPVASYGGNFGYGGDAQSAAGLNPQFLYQQAQAATGGGGY